MTDYTLDIPTEAEITHVWDHMRAYDKEEVTLQGYNKDTFTSAALAAEAFVGKVCGEVACVFGASERVGAVYVWFLGTPTVDAYWKTIHQSAKGFLEWVDDKYPDKQVCVQVWTEHRQSLTWLKRLGFAETGIEWGEPGKRLRLLRRN